MVWMDSNSGCEDLETGARMIRLGKWLDPRMSDSYT